MLLHEFGNTDGKRIVLIHGTCMSWNMFENIIAILSRDHHVIAVSVPGHDPETKENFTSVEDISLLIENELMEKGYRDIDLLYGLSMGGAFVLRMLADNRLRVKHAVMDGGITPYEYSYPVTRMILLKDYLLTKAAQYDQRLLKTAFPDKDYTKAGTDAMYRVLKHMSNRTLWNVYRSTDNYKMPETFPEIPTVIEYWYGEKEKEERKTDIAYMKKHIPHVIFREIPEMKHGQYVMTMPKRFCEDLCGDEEVREANDRSLLHTDYRNWVPQGMITGLAAGTAALGVLTIGAAFSKRKEARIVRDLAGIGTLVCAGMTAWSIYAHDKFSYDGERKLSKEIVEGIAEYVDLPEDGTGLDVGCGSGALTIACARRNPQAQMVGVDRWGPEYASYSRKLCTKNAAAEGVTNTYFEKGDAVSLPYRDESFDCITSNYVYHNISGHNKQALLKESLRVLKKGGTFAIHDLMSPLRYGDMKKFMQELKESGYEEVRLIPTDNGMFMSKSEAFKLMLTGSALLDGRK